MISVIVPTMWRAPHYKKMFPLLDKHPLVGEIIVIDNDTSQTDQSILDLKKIVYLPQKENIYVNPAWNLGVSVSKYDELLILNDDCLINPSCLTQIIWKISPDKGIFGFSELSYCSYSFETFDQLCSMGLGSAVEFEEVDVSNNKKNSGMPHFSYGSAMFLHKQNYYTIPEEFKIYYGDLFIFLMNLKHNKINYTIEDGLVCTNMSSTVSSKNSPIESQIEYERKIFDDVLARYELAKILLYPE